MILTNWTWQEIDDPTVAQEDAWWKAHKPADEEVDEEKEEDEEEDEEENDDDLLASEPTPTQDD